MFLTCETVKRWKVKGTLTLRRFQELLESMWVSTTVLSLGEPVPDSVRTGLKFGFVYLETLHYSVCSQNM